MEITLERFSNSNDQEILDVPITQTVDDAQLGFPQDRITLGIKGKSTLQFKRGNNDSLINGDSGTLQLPKCKAVSFIDKNHMILESIDESPGATPTLKLKDDMELNFENMVMNR